MSATQGVIEAITGAIGEANNDFGGLRITRLLTDIPAGTTTLPLERTYDWPASGRVSIDGAVYHYTTNNDGSLAGVYYLSGGIPVSGTLVDHKALTAVIDASQTYSSLDLVRRSLLVAYAEGDDLSALGRNLGVLRLPDVRSDDQFRAIIQALAYNPKTTIYGLSQALDALVGPGNYTISEDLLGAPCTLSVHVPGALFLANVPQGKTYLSGTTQLPADPDGMLHYAFPGTNPTQPYVRCSGIRLADTNVWTDCRQARPSASLETRYPGDAGVYGWAYSGSGSETTNFGVTAGVGYARLTGAIARYERQNPIIRPTSRATVRALFCVPDATQVASDSPGQHGAQILDGLVQMGWGVTSVDATHYSIGLRNPSTGALMGTARFQATQGVYYEVELVRRTDRWVELRVNGALIDRQPSTSFPSTASTSVGYGAYTASASVQPKPITRYVGTYQHSADDFLGLPGQAGSVAAAAPATLTSGAAGAFAAGDVGHQVRITGSTAANARGGNNNCNLQVRQVLSDTQVVLGGPTLPNAQVDAVHPNRVTITNTPGAFTYPDDLGKTITLEQSALGNAGTYTITALYDPVTGTDLASYSTHLTQTTNVCAVASASFVPETGIPWHLTPAFVNESPLSWYLADVATLTGSAGAGYKIAARGGLPYPNAIYDITVNTVLSAQVMPVDYVVNFYRPGPPPSYTYWPFYILDPYNYVEQYVNQIVAAGVVVNFHFD